VPPSGSSPPPRTSEPRGRSRASRRPSRACAGARAQTRPEAAGQVSRKPSARDGRPGPRSEVGSGRRLSLCDLDDAAGLTRRERGLGCRRRSVRLLDIDPGGRAGVVPLSKRGPPLQGHRALLPVAGHRRPQRRPGDRQAPHDDLRRGSRPPAVQQPVRRVLAVRRPRADPRALRPRLRSPGATTTSIVTARAARLDRAVHLVDAAATILAHPRVSVGCPYTGPIRGHRVRQRPPRSPRFFTHAMGRDGVGNALNVNRTLEVGGSTPLGSTYDSTTLPARWLRIFAVSSRGGVRKGVPADPLEGCARLGLQRQAVAVKDAALLDRRSAS
jgi:hypothetical protein